MADPEPPKKAKKLPHLTKTGDDTEGEKKVVKKKKKKPATETNGTASTPTKEGTPRKKKKPATPKTTESEDKPAENGEATTTETKPTPRKRKKRKATGDEEQKDPTSARSQGEDVAGSKTSLIAKEQSTGGTPKKKGKKKVKKTPRTSATPREEDEFLDATFAADLTTIQEDIVMPSTDKTEKDEEEEGEDDQRHPYSTESAILKSQPLQKLFIETDSGFRGQDKARHAKKMAEEQAYKAEQPVQESRTTIEFALSTQSVLNTGYLFIHGVTAGISVWQILMTYILLSFPYLDFIEHYRTLALPVQSLFYILLMLCTLSSCDRFDVGHITRRFVIQSITLQTGTVAVIIYLAAMVVSLSAAGFEDKMNIFGSNTTAWNNTAAIESEFTTWQNLNVARCALAILGWLVISIVPSTQRLSDNLREGEDNLWGTKVEMIGSNA